jgi:hypothetical protein
MDLHADACQELIDLAALRLEPGECIAGWWDELEGASLDERIYYLEKLQKAEVEAHRRIGQVRKEGLLCFVVAYDGDTWSVLGASKWSDREGRPIPSSGTGAHCWSETHPLYRGQPGLCPLASVRLLVTPRLRPSALAMRVAA